MLALCVNFSCLSSPFDRSALKIQQEIYEDFSLNLLKAVAVMLVGKLSLNGINKFFELQDDLAISKVKENCAEYNEAKSVKKKAKITRAILTEYYGNFTLTKKWGRKTARYAILLAAGCGSIFYYIRAFAYLYKMNVNRENSSWEAINKIMKL